MMNRPLLLAGLSLALTSAACGTSPETNALWSNDSARLELSGPRILSPEELRAARPTPLIEGETKDAAPPQYPDLSGFIWRSSSASTQVAPAGVGRLNQALTGPIWEQSNRYNASLTRGGSMIIQLLGKITAASLNTASGDADLYMENCDGSEIQYSTRGGLSPDYGQVNTDPATCRRVRVYGYQDSTFELAVFEFN